jgi:hypothetical protein
MTRVSVPETLGSDLEQSFAYLSSSTGDRKELCHYLFWCHMNSLYHTDKDFITGNSGETTPVSAQHTTPTHTHTHTL